MVNPTLIPTQINRRTLITNILVLFSGSAISQGLTAVVLLLTARQIGPEEYGVYSSSIVLATFLSIFFSLGLDIWLIKEGGAHPQEIGRMAGSVLGIKIGLGSLWFLSIFLLSKHLIPSSSSQTVIWLAAAVVWLDSILNTFQAIFKSALRNQVTSILLISSDFTWLVGTVLLVLSGVGDAAKYLEIRIYVLILSLAAIGIYTWLQISPTIRIQTLQRIKREFFPYSTSEFLVMALLRADVLLIAIILGQESVGFYAPALSLINAMYLIPNSLHGVMLPALSNLFTVNIKHAWNVARKLILIQASIGLGLSIGVFFISPYLVRLLGPKYMESLPILKILSFNLFFHGISFSMVSILVAINQQAKRAFLQFIAVIINVLLNLGMLYWMGIQGAAITYVVTEIVLAGGYAFLVYTSLKNFQISIQRNYR